MIIIVGGRAFQIKPGGLDSVQWAISVVKRFVCIPQAVAIRYFPDEWFSVIARIVGEPVVVLYMLGSKGAKIAKAMFKRKKAVKDSEAEVVTVLAISVVSDGATQLPT